MFLYLLLDREWKLNKLAKFRLYKKSGFLSIQKRVLVIIFFKNSLFPGLYFKWFFARVWSKPHHVLISTISHAIITTYKKLRYENSPPNSAENILSVEKRFSSLSKISRENRVVKTKTPDLQLGFSFLCLITSQSLIPPSCLGDLAYQTVKLWQWTLCINRYTRMQQKHKSPRNHNPVQDFNLRSFCLPLVSLDAALPRFVMHITTHASCQCLAHQDHYISRPNPVPFIYKDKPLNVSGRFLN